MEAATTTDIVWSHPAVMSTPWFMFIVLSLYVFIVYRLGPEFMKFRKPFELKKLIIGHNIIQVVSCVFVVHEILHITNNTIVYFWKCSIVEITEVRMQRLFRLEYFLFWLKLSELIETVIFIMRKKQSQVTKLHVFHHISTVTLVYVLIHYNENGTDALFSAFLNSMVHIIMYSYYLVAAVADKNIVRKLTPIKKSITIIQMVQFMMILIHASIVMSVCGCPKVTFIYFCVVIIVMFYGFYDFYKDSYNREQLRKSENEAIPIVSLYDGIIATTKKTE